MSVNTVFHLDVEMEDGSTWKVDADQRDFARWEAHPDGVPFHSMMLKPFLTLRFLAFNAGKRGRLHGFTSFETFDAACLQVNRLDEDDDAEDPGHPAASAGT